MFTEPPGTGPLTGGIAFLTALLIAQTSSLSPARRLPPTEVLAPPATGGLLRATEGRRHRHGGLRVHTVRKEQPAAIEGDASLEVAPRHEAV